MNKQSAEIIEVIEEVEKEVIKQLSMPGNSLRGLSEATGLSILYVLCSIAKRSYMD